MKVPNLNRKLILEGRSRNPDGAGGYVDSWNAIGTLWADVKLGSGRERSASGGDSSSVTYRITVRAAPIDSPQRPRPEQRFRDGQRLFQIEAVGETTDFDKYLTCWAKEEVLT